MSKSSPGGCRMGAPGQERKPWRILHQAAAEKAPYSVAIIDLQMPDMDGLALVRKINADPTTERDADHSVDSIRKADSEPTNWKP